MLSLYVYFHVVFLFYLILLLVFVCIYHLLCYYLTAHIQWQNGMTYINSSSKIIFKMKININILNACPINENTKNLFKSFNLINSISCSVLWIAVKNTHSHLYLQSLSLFMLLRWINVGNICFQQYINFNWVHKFHVNLLVLICHKTKTSSNNNS